MPKEVPGAIVFAGEVVREAMRIYGSTLADPWETCAVDENLPIEHALGMLQEVTFTITNIRGKRFTAYCQVFQVGNQWNLALVGIRHHVDLVGETITIFQGNRGPQGIRVEKVVLTNE